MLNRLGLLQISQQETKMTVPITTKHEILPSTPSKNNSTNNESDNETCCTEENLCDCGLDHTDSLLKDLDKNCNETLALEKAMKKSKIEYDEIYYEKARQLKHYDDAPEHLKHNQYIRTGYRGLLSTGLCWESVFWWTNESINIWSHIFGLVLFICLTAYDMVTINVYASTYDKIVLGCVLLSFEACMILSALYHTFNCRSAEDCEKFLCYDLFGIALSLFAIYMSGIYYAFWCSSNLLTFYISTISVIFVIAMILQIPALNIDPNVKLLVFVAWAAYGVVPTIHWTIVHGGLANPIVELLLPRVIGMYAISGTAFLIYITKVPERFYSGRFDFIGHSHQWWHLFVVGAFWYWHNSGMLYIDYRLNHACPDNLRIIV